MNYYSKQPFKQNVDHDSDNTIHLFSEKCVDELHLELKIENNIIVDAKYEGVGCAVFLSSVNIMLEKITNLSIDETKLLLENYIKMLKQKETYDEVLLDKLIVFENVNSHLNRLHCAEMIYLALEKAIS